METITLPAGHPESINSAIELLHAGEIVAFPTDTVYGIAASLAHTAASFLWAVPPTLVLMACRTMR